MNKCKGCQWYGKPYWSVINPCDNCLRENDNVQIPTRIEYTSVDETDSKVEELKRTIVIMEKYLSLIINIGYDYDGFSNSEDLIKLIDAMVEYAELAKNHDVSEPIYMSGGKKYNILLDELEDE